MTNRNAPSAGESSGSSTGEATGQLLPASPLTLEAVRALAISALEAEDFQTARAFLREQVQMLEQLIEQSESEEEAIYEWASGQ